jgi:hypothetical protein
MFRKQTGIYGKHKLKLHIDTYLMICLQWSSQQAETSTIKSTQTNAEYNCDVFILAGLCTMDSIVTSSRTLPSFDEKCIIKKIK